MSGVPNRFKGVQYIEYPVLVQSIYLWLKEKLKRTRGNTIKVSARDYFKWLDECYKPTPIDCAQFYVAFDEVARVEGLVRVEELEPKGSYKRGRVYLILDRLRKVEAIRVLVGESTI